jgi:hypothetical protein
MFAPDVSWAWSLLHDTTFGKIRAGQNRAIALAELE